MKSHERYSTLFSGHSLLSYSLVISLTKMRHVALHVTIITVIVPYLLSEVTESRLTITHALTSLLAHTLIHTRHTRAIYHWPFTDRLTPSVDHSSQSLGYSQGRTLPMFTHSICVLTHSYLFKPFTPSNLITPSNTHPFGILHWFLHTLFHSILHSLLHSPLTHSFTHSFTHSITHSFTPSLLHSLLHSLTHSFTTHSPGCPDQGLTAVRSQWERVTGKLPMKQHVSDPSPRGHTWSV